MSNTIQVGDKVEWVSVRYPKGRAGIVKFILNDHSWALVHTSDSQRDTWVRMKNLKLTKLAPEEA